jgi:hypothetical protein
VHLKLFHDLSKKTLHKSKLRVLSNCYDAHQYFAFKERFESFKTKKSYFLTGMDDEEIRLIFLEFIFFRFAVKNKIYPQVSKGEILNYYDKRKSEIETKNENIEFIAHQI